MSDAAFSPLAGLVTELRERYPQAEPPDVVRAVLHARNGLQLMQIGDLAGDAMLATLAERELRLRLGLETDDARLDPERHNTRDLPPRGTSR